MYGTCFHDWTVLRTQHTESSDAFWEFSACKVCKEVLGAFYRLFSLKSKLFEMKIRCIFWVIRLQSVQKWFGRIFEVFTLQVKKKFWAHFLDFCVQKRRYFPWSSDAFWKFSACKVYRNSCGRNSTICVQNWSGLLWSSDAFRKFSPCKLYKKGSGRIFPIYASKNEAVSRGVQTHFGSSLAARFTEKSSGRNSRLVRPRTKPFAVKFRRILEVSARKV